MSQAKQQTWKHLKTCVLLLLIAIPSKRTLRQFPARQPMHECIFKERNNNYQQQLWIQAPLKMPVLERNAELYDFTFVKKENLVVPDN